MRSNLILLRHGESVWNLENKFTGWTNVDLTKNGEKEGIKSGILILEEGLKIKNVFVSYLKRAKKTSELCLKQLKPQKFEVVYDWRLNERHYGNLQGLNKAETAKKYGDDQVLLWRRSYDIPPPPLSENDKRHPKYDSMYKSLDKSLLPNGESLKNTLERVKPLWFKKILPKLKVGENTLIVAHGNSLRAIVMMIKSLSKKEVLKLNIPTGIPYLFQFDNKLNLACDKYLGISDEIAKNGKLISPQDSSKIR